MRANTKILLPTIVLLALLVGVAQAADWSQQQKLTAADAVVGDRFGFSVAVDGHTALVGASLADVDGNSGQGAAYVFVRSGSTWTQQQKLTASDGAADDYFGFSVTVDGNTALVGAIGDNNNGADSGAVYVYTRSGTVWNEQAKLIASDAAAHDKFGYSVAVSGNTAVVGAHGDDDNGADSGAAYVFVRSGGTWTQQAKLTASDAAANDEFGVSVAVDGDTAVVGAYGDDDSSPDSGAAYVFIRSGTVWSEQQKLNAYDAAEDDYFGISVAVSGDTAVVGAYGDGAYEDDDLGPESGSAYVYTRSGGVWTEQAKLNAYDITPYDWFGRSVAVSGNIAIVGSSGDDDLGPESGAAYVFTRSEGIWSEEYKLKASDGATEDWFGSRVAVNGDTALVGAWLADVGGNSNQGAAYIFPGSIGYSVYLPLVVRNHGSGTSIQGPD